MRPSIFNIISAIVFSIMAIVCLWAAFQNPIHFIFGAGSVLLVVIAVFDDIDGISIARWVKEKFNHTKSF